MRPTMLALVFLLGSSQLGLALATQQPANTLPVREVTAFKDGHAYVLREQPLATPGGTVVLDELPAPVLGTFWPFATGGAKVVSAVAGHAKTTEWSEALDFQQMIEANLGKAATVYLKPTAFEQNGEVLSGKLLSVPQVTEAGVVHKSGLFLLEMSGGTRAVPFDALRSVMITGVLEKRAQREVERDRLTLRIEGRGPEARVGVVYVQKGLRWIPAYKVDLDGAGHARVALEATLVNDLIDLNDVTVNLVIGVPSIEFRDLVDPISLQREAAAVSAAQRFDATSAFSNRLSNSIMTQTMDGGDARAPAGPEVVPDGTSAEDLFVFTVQHVTLAKGERMVLPIAEHALEYRDVYTLEVPLAPPPEADIRTDNDRAAQLARELGAPKVRHVARLKNTSGAPITTAPALVLANGRVLAQGRAKYAPIGAEWSLELTTAVDVGVKVDMQEASRTPNAATINRNDYTRLDMTGTIELVNSKSQAVDLEVRQLVLGQVDQVGQGGTPKQIDSVAFWALDERPIWISWWNFPWWWYRLNGFGQLSWKLRLEPGAKTALDARWHYFWG